LELNGDSEDEGSAITARTSCSQAETAAEDNWGERSR